MRARLNNDPLRPMQAESPDLSTYMHLYAQKVKEKLSAEQAAMQHQWEMERAELVKQVGQLRMQAAQREEAEHKSAALKAEQNSVLQQNLSAELAAMQCQRDEERAEHVKQVGQLHEKAAEAEAELAGVRTQMEAAQVGLADLKQNLKLMCS